MTKTYTEWLNGRQEKAALRKAERAPETVREPKVIVPHPGTLNRAQRRAQGRYDGFLSGEQKAVGTKQIILKRSGRNPWTKADRAKLQAKVDKLSNPE